MPPCHAPVAAHAAVATHAIAAHAVAAHAVAAHAIAAHAVATHPVHAHPVHAHPVAVAAVKLHDGAGQHFGPAVLDAVDVVLRRAGRRFHLDVQLLQPLLNFFEDPGVGSDGDQRIDPVHRNELHVARLAAEGDGLEHSFHLLGQIAGAAVRDFEQAHALGGEGVAVEHGDQLEGPAHVAPAVQNHHQVGGRVNKGLRAFAHEGRQQLGQLVDGGVLQKDQVQQNLVVLRHALGVQLLGPDRQPDGGGQQDHAVQIAHLDHRRPIDAQDHVQQGARVDVLHFAVGVQDDAALHLRVEHVVDLENARQLVHYLHQRGVLEVESAEGGRARWRRGRRRGALGGRGGGRRLALRSLRPRLGGGLRGRGGDARPEARRHDNLRQGRRRLLCLQQDGRRQNRRTGAQVEHCPTPYPSSCPVEEAPSCLPWPFPRRPVPTRSTPTSCGPTSPPRRESCARNAGCRPLR